MNFFIFRPNEYTLVSIGTHTGIHWDTAYIYTSVCMPNDMNKHQPRIIKVAHNLYSENSLNTLFINTDGKIKF